MKMIHCVNESLSIVSNAQITTSEKIKMLELLIMSYSQRAGKALKTHLQSVDKCKKKLISTLMFISSIAVSQEMTIHAVAQPPYIFEPYGDGEGALIEATQMAFNDAGVDFYS